MTTALARAKAKRARRPIYGEFVEVAVLSTGEKRTAFIASHPIDRNLLKERGWRKGDEVRAEFKRPRNVKFHRLAHAIGVLLVENVEGFEMLDGHDALKRVQLESGVCCEMIEMDASPVVSALLDAAEALLGKGARVVLAGVLPKIKKIPVKIAESLAFDEMTAERFDTFFNGITDYIDRTYQSAMTDNVRAEYLLMVQGDK